jgi:hypothetical protein
VAFLAAPEAAEVAGATRAGSAGARARTGAAAKRRSRVKQQVDKASSPITDDMSAAQVTEELQHRRRVAAAAKADDQADDQADDDSTPVTKPDPSSKAAPLFVAGKLAPAQTGGGFVLGVMGWVLFRNYLEGGVPQVKRLLAAKFLNKTGA